MTLYADVTNFDTSCMYTNPFHNMGPDGVNFAFFSRPDDRAESGDLKEKYTVKFRKRNGNGVEN